MKDEYSIDWVPNAARHGQPFQQFTLWLSANLQITAIVNGALAVVFGVHGVTALLGLLLGNILGGTVMALHAAQGPRLGLPQMISSRVQFGVKGAALPLLLAIIMYLGFATTGTVLSGQAINRILDTDGSPLGMVVFGVTTGVIAIAGYNVIHKLGRIASVVSIAGFSFLAWRLLSAHPLDTLLTGPAGDISQLLLAMSLSAGWQLTFAPYVADYSRYLPADTPSGKVFWPVFLGTTIGAQCAMSFGVLVVGAGDSFIKNQVGFMGELAGPILAMVIYFAIVAGKLTVNCLNAYGGLMCSLTIVSGINGARRFSPKARSLVIALFIALSVVLAIFASHDFLANFKNFVLLLLVAFVPWSAVNLIDYYLISREKVDIPALYQPEGRYGTYNLPALVSYGVGILSQVPFINQAIYTGFAVKLLGNTDISWIVGLLVTALVYYPWAKRTTRVPAQMVYLTV
ncbi:cytosine permease [Aquitalea sp. LB_tupeE]|uniref:purine-cytosine permease family protein n=1 Tax=Aquitalea sp. LB_tupeE TaxID=2748078 RepID=UPI0015B9093B|nr:cytosine permease [Aquitalea sp. LB_tupeE]NWK79672.1 cytosine permease [Aquitalea sp. LB_tupeE]